MTFITPTPWTIKNANNQFATEIVSDNEAIAQIYSLLDGKNNEKKALVSEANAKRIVHCVNTYDELVEVCEKALKFLTGEEPSPLEVEGFQIDLEYTLDKAKNS